MGSAPWKTQAPDNLNRESHSRSRESNGMFDNCMHSSRHKTVIAELRAAIVQTMHSHQHWNVSRLTITCTRTSCKLTQSHAQMHTLKHTSKYKCVTFHVLALDLGAFALARGLNACGDTIDLWSLASCHADNRPVAPAKSVDLSVEPG